MVRRRVWHTIYIVHPFDLSGEITTSASDEVVICFVILGCCC